MLTPVFSIKQDCDTIIVEIKAPYGKVTEADAHASGNELYFVCPPYLLHLYFNQFLADDDSESASYDADTGTFTLCAQKKTSGEDFTGLDMITELLRPKGVDRYEGVSEILQEEDLKEAEIQISQNSDQTPTTSSNGYGFASMKDSVFEKLREEIGMLLQLPRADTLTNEERLKFDHQNTIDSFDVNYYLADLHEPDENLRTSLKFVPWWPVEMDSQSEILDEWCRTRLKDLPKHSLTHVSTEKLVETFRSLFDVLFAYAYDVRTTEGEHNCESGWTVQRVSASLSCLCSWADARSPVVSSVRRALVFPLHRHWRLASLCAADVCKIVRMGRAAVLRCLLHVHWIFATSGDYRYILNDLYITDYCLALQQIHCHSAFDIWSKELLSLGALKKKDVELNLEEIEVQAEMENLNLKSENNHAGGAELDSDDEPSV